MAFSPEAFYTVANELRTRASSDEGYMRTVISRAYYGAFLVARDAKSLSSIGPTGHRNVIDAYQSSASDKLIADRLIKLKKLREKADYQPGYKLSPRDADDALAGCRRVLMALKALPQPGQPGYSAAKQSA